MVDRGDDLPMGLVSALRRNHADEPLGDVRVGTLDGISLDIAQAAGSGPVRRGVSRCGGLQKIVSAIRERLVKTNSTTRFRRHETLA